MSSNLFINTPSLTGEMNTSSLLEKEEEDEYCIDWQIVGRFLILFGFFLAIMGGVLDFKIECDTNGNCILYPFTYRFYIMYASGICIMCFGFYKI
jgi:hypothetical protein